MEPQASNSSQDKVALPLQRVPSISALLAMTDAAQPEFLRPSIMDSTAIKYQLAHQLGLFDHPEPVVSSTGKSTSAQSDKDKATTDGIDALLSVARDSNSQNSKGSSAAGTKCRNKLVSTPYLRKDRAKVLRDWFEANLDKPYPSPQMKRELQERSGATAVQIRNWFLNARRRRSGCHANDVKRQAGTSFSSGKHFSDPNSSAASGGQRGERDSGDEDDVVLDSLSESSQDDGLLLEN